MATRVTLTFVLSIQSCVRHLWSFCYISLVLGVSAFTTKRNVSTKLSSRETSVTTASLESHAGNGNLNGKS